MRAAGSVLVLVDGRFSFPVSIVSVKHLNCDSCFKLLPPYLDIDEFVVERDIHGFGKYIGRRETKCLPNSS